jgi:hypothetical protein
LIQLRLDVSLDHFGRLHGCVPFVVASAIDRRMADVFEPDA